MNPLYSQQQMPANNPLAMLDQLKQNPYQLLAQRGFNIPQNLYNPNDILQYLINTNQVTQQQVNNVMTMLQRR
jgi:hypothetical protein